MNIDAKILTKRRKAKYRAILNRYGPITIAPKLKLDMLFYDLYNRQLRDREGESGV